MKKMAAKKKLLDFDYILEDKLREKTTFLIHISIPMNTSYDNFMELKNSILELWFPSAYQANMADGGTWFYDIDLAVGNLLEASGYEVPKESEVDSDVD